MSTTTEEINENPGAGPAKSIKAIDRGSVHRICSGQVVLNLATAVKELVENSLDAGATQVEVKLKEFGSELLEVSDNGSGVEEDNFEGLTLKHHTSKLSDFSDLVSVDTFGFRGEALSSLCALSDVTVTTRHTAVPVGTKLTYDHNGGLLQRSPCPRQCGTTVCLQNLFSTLPVRHKEFKRNLKKEFNKMVQVLQAYCIITKNVRISCSNQCGKGKKNLVLNTNGNDTLKDNITNIFGAKQIQSLIEFQQYEPSEEACKELGIDVPELHKSIFRMKGYVSSSVHGQGRSSSDRQYYFINNRPCDPPKISRTVNEVYHQFNRHQYPVVVLDISLAKDDVDVNVTPDKRQLFIQNEKLLLAILKSSLQKMFEPESSSFSLNNTSNTLTNMFGKISKSQSTPPAVRQCDQSNPLSPVRRASFPLSSSSAGQNKSSPALSNLKRSFASAFAKDEAKLPSPSKDKQRRLDGFLSVSLSPKVNESSTSPKMPDVELLGLDSSSLHLKSGSASSTSVSEDTDSAYRSDDRSDDLNSLSSSEPLTESQTLVVIEDASGTATETEDEGVESVDRFLDDVQSCVVESSQSASREVQLNEEHSIKLTVIEDDDISSTTEETALNDDNRDRKLESKTSLTSVQSEISCKVDIHKGEERLKEVIDIKVTTLPELENEELGKRELDEPEDVNRKNVSLPFSMEKLRERLKAKKKAKQTAIEGRKFRAKITPGENNTAEEELKMQISKDMFERMEILGQFNLGFIIAKLEKDLFIIDQHATDEKYNFEDLQKNTHIKSQPLIQPQILGLTAASEEILLDNLEIFRKNGFDFVIDKEAPPTERAKLTAIPMSKDWAFGKDDVDELVFMLSDSPGVLCRPSRVRNMFASRSCRKSIMIGTALNKQEMRKLVNHMGEMDQPWNCPHGRPTMRHLINLDTISE